MLCNLIAKLLQRVLPRKYVWFSYAQYMNLRVRESSIHEFCMHDLCIMYAYFMKYGVNTAGTWQEHGT